MNILHRIKPISRRSMLKGVGALMGLPLLEAMMPIKVNGNTVLPKGPVRMAVLYMPNGINPHTWTPQGTGENFQLSRVLEPLAPVQSEILVLSGLANRGTFDGDAHYARTAAFLTGTTITKTSGLGLSCGGVSIDQIAARKIGYLTPIPSLELGIEPVNTKVDTNVGYTKLYGCHISWDTATTPLPKEINPQLAFDRVFGVDRSVLRSNSSRTESILDIVKDDAKMLSRQIGKADRVKLDEYFESVRAVERRIEFEAKRKKAEISDGGLSRREIEKLGQRIRDLYADPGASERGVNHTEHVRLMLDIMVLAFWADITRISTFMFGNAVTSRNFSFLEGVSGGHHEISHHENMPEQLEQYARINLWHVEQYAYMLQKMRAIQEGETNLLHNSMVLFGSGIRDGNSHNPRDLPIVLAGRGSGTIKPGRHLSYEPNTPMCNLYRSMLAGMGAPVEDLADSTGQLNDLHA